MLRNWKKHALIFSKWSELNNSEKHHLLFQLNASVDSTVRTIEGQDYSGARWFEDVEVWEVTISDVTVRDYFFSEEEALDEALYHLVNKYNTLVFFRFLRNPTMTMTAAFEEVA